MKYLEEYLRILYNFETPRLLEKALELRSITEVETIELCYCDTWPTLYIARSRYSFPPHLYKAHMRLIQSVFAWITRLRRSGDSVGLYRL